VYDTAILRFSRRYVELAMFLRGSQYRIILSLFLCTALAPAVFGQRPTPNPGATNKGGEGATALNGGDPTIEMEVYVRGADGAPIEVTAVVTLTSPTGQVAVQGTTLGGNIKFSGLAASPYTIQVVAPGYENAIEEFNSYNSGAARVTIAMRPASHMEETAPGPSRIVLAPKAQKEVGKALEALRANKPAAARSHLDAAYRLAPSHPEVNYLFGVYFSQLKDLEKAKSYWTKTLEFDPKHSSALLSLSEVLMREKNLADAESYVKRAVDAEPSSWRAHAIFADVFLQRHFPDEAIKQAERALELGHGGAVTVQPLLARALAEGGNKERAAKVLQAYIQDRPSDAAARGQLESLGSPVALIAANNGAGAPTFTAEAKASTATDAAVALPLPSSWLPPDVDETVPAVEPGAVCALDEVLQKTGKRVLEFVKSVDRFTASEFLKHESINKWGSAGAPETRKFNYVVAVEETRPGILNVEEYRIHGDLPVEFPGGVATLGLPALALIFHPYNAGNFEMSCEGLGQWNGQPVWQVHFRQRADKPNTFREYRIGQNGPAFPVGVRGRALIATDSYQILRMETDLVAKIPQIRLVADHMVVEYGPVSFRKRNVQMWLPQTAELYSEWKGHRIHRIHSFSNYLLFSVDEKQQISAPKEN
jgi:tetratricopeptide (TPR) repeat protein